jgi:hypothetical protein
MFITGAGTENDTDASDGRMSTRSTVDDVERWAFVPSGGFCVFGPRLLGLVR